jgi:hypothetical protein
LPPLQEVIFILDTAIAAFSVMVVLPLVEPAQPLASDTFATV